MYRYQALYPSGRYYGQSLLLMGKAYFRGGSYSEAMETLKECSNGFPRSREGEEALYLMGYFMFGLPGETYETARRSIQLMKSLPYDNIALFIAKPLPGSYWFEEWAGNKKIDEINYNWFGFIEVESTLEFTDGKRKLKLPIDAYREFYLRPIEIWRYLKY